jgi:hypothetical protein
MASDRPAHGTLLQLKLAGVFTTVGLRAEIGGVQSELNIRDTTHLDSQYVTKRPAIVDLGSMSLTLFFDPDDTMHTTLRLRAIAPPATGPDLWKLIYNTPDTTPPHDDFSGYLTKFNVMVGGPMDTVKAECEIAITDAFAATAGVP